MASKEACLVLRDEGARTGAKHRDLLLDFLYVILAGLEVDLYPSFSIQAGSMNWLA